MEVGPWLHSACMIWSSRGVNFVCAILYYSCIKYYYECMSGARAFKVLSLGYAARPSLCLPHPHQIARVRRYRHSGAGTRHRREYRHFQRSE
ncbi:hypothetical protein SBA3_700003 [Candidatus Sulfopaludibacter sp. SbA3]|nr:hypothetical protein SBA3_700003 [Candidatus Sulfopaludibacter sp. SbA3]